MANQTINRFFYRCIGCLEVVTLAERLPFEYSTTVAKCSNCQQGMEFMGRVQRDRLVHDTVQCKCDDRCTSARGPNCECSCGGENHGTGMAGYIQVAVDAGKVPTVVIPSSARSAKAAAQYQEFDTLRAEFRSILSSLLDRRRRGEFLPRPDFMRMRDLQRLNGKLPGYRTHAARMKALHSVLNTTIAA